MWARYLNTILGVWLMAAPVVLDYAAPARTNDRIVGPLVISLAVIAIWEVTRPLRRINTLLGAWLLLAPWLLGYQPGLVIGNSMGVGALILLFSLVPGRRETRVGGGWRVLWQSTSQEK